MSLFSDELSTPEQLKMPDVLCPHCGQRWPLVAPKAPEVETIESAPVVVRMPDGSIITSQTTITIEPPEEEIQP